jgi:molybdopterin synthase catalytic subunit
MPVIAAISDRPLSLDDHVAAVANVRHGAIASFTGIVRDHDPSVDGAVTALEYAAHPDAQAVLERLASQAEAEHDAVVAVTHRIGLLAVGELAIVVAAGSAHRAEAFAACESLVEKVKAELPVWKREILADGSHTWVGIA